MRHVDRTDEAIALLTFIAEINNVDVKTLRDRGQQSKRAEYIKIRRSYAVTGRAMGLSTIEMGIAMNRDHTTMSYHANPVLRERKKGNVGRTRIWTGRTPQEKADRRKRESRQQEMQDA